MKKKQLTVPRSELILDAAPGVLRAHTIADVLRALARHDALTWSTGARDAVAEELNVPALWLDAAVGEQHHNPTNGLIGRRV